MIREISLKIFYGFVCVYTVLFFATAPIVTHFATKTLKDDYNVTLSIDSFAVEPLSARIQINGLSLRYQNEQKPFIAFKHLDVRASWAALFKQALVIDEIRLDSLFVRASMDKNKTVNIQKIFASKHPSASSSKPFLFSINNISLRDADIDFFDETSQQRLHFAHTSLSLPFVSNIPYDAKIFIKPSFSTVMNGSSVSIVGKTRPFAKDVKSELAFHINQFNLALLEKFMPRTSGVEHLEGIFDANVRIAFEKTQNAAEPQRLTLQSDATVKHLSIDVHNNVHLANADMNISGFEVRLPTKEVILRSFDFAARDMSAPQHIGVSAPYAHLNGLHGNLQTMSLALNEFKTTMARVDIPSASTRVSAIDANTSNVYLSLRDKNITAASVSLNNAHIDMTKKHSIAPSSGTSRASASQNDKPWKIAIASVDAHTNIAYQDSHFIHDKPFSIQLKPFDVHLRNLQNSTDVPIEVNASFASKVATAAMSGAVRPLSKKADIRAKIGKLDMTLADTFGFLPNGLRLVGGSFGASARILADFGTSAIHVSMTNANANIKRFDLYDDASNRRVFSFDTFYIKNMRFAYPSMDTTIDGMALSGFYASLDIDQNKTLNIMKYMPPSDKKAQSAQNSAIKSKTPALRIGKISLADGRIDFSDRSLAQRFRTSLTDVVGTVGGITLDKNVSSSIDLRANSGGYGKVAIFGDVTPDSKRFALNIKVKTIEFPMTQFTPYTQKFIGYKIASGSLGLDLNYKILGKKLDSTNAISLLGFNLGDEVESKTAIHLPYKLAIAILKDDAGNIDVELPVQGSLDDPDIKSGHVVWKLIKQLVIKVVKAPFSALASLFGGGDDLGYAQFEYGTTTIRPSEVAKLKKTAMIINKKPTLKAMLTGYVDAQQDIPAYKLAQFEMKVKQAKAKAEKLPANANVVVSQAEYAKYVKLAYKNETFAKPKNFLGFDKSLTTDQMKTLIVTHVDAGAAQMSTLAKMRAEILKKQLIQEGVAPTHIEVSTKALTAAEQKDGVSNARVEVGFE